MAVGGGLTSFFEPRRVSSQGRSGAVRWVSGRALDWGQIEQFPVAWVFEKFIQILEHEFLVRQRGVPVA